MVKPLDGGQATGYISARGLQGAQSVRATFRLPEELIQLLGIMARQLGLQQKSLFDQLIEDGDILQQVVAAGYVPGRGLTRRRQKTYVLSRRSLEILERVARHQNIPRDILVEISIERLLPIMNAEREKHRKRQALQQKLDSVRKEYAKLAIEAATQLGSDDQASLLLQEIYDVVEENNCELLRLVEKGEAVDEYGKKGEKHFAGQGEKQ